VDDIYCESLPFFPLKHELEHPLVLKRDDESIWRQSFGKMVIKGFDRLLVTFYTLFFYYFTPFWIIGIPIIYNRATGGGSDH
jgi:hypothetical protein